MIFHKYPRVIITCTCHTLCMAAHWLILTTEMKLAVGSSMYSSNGYYFHVRDSKIGVIYTE